MDIVATQTYEDYDSTPTQKISYSTQQDKVQVKINFYIFNIYPPLVSDIVLFHIFYFLC